MNTFYQDQNGIYCLNTFFEVVIFFNINIYCRSKCFELMNVSLVKRFNFLLYC